jgi:hypothetical protein
LASAAKGGPARRWQQPAATMWRLAGWLVALIALTDGIRAASARPVVADSTTSARPAPPLDAKRALLFWRITVVLQLQPETATRVFEVLDRHEQKMNSLRRDRMRLMRDIQGAIEGKASDAALRGLIDRWLRLQALRRASREARWEILGALLTPLQLAQVMVLIPRLESGATTIAGTGSSRR